MKPTLSDWEQSYLQGREYGYLGTQQLTRTLERIGLQSGRALDIGCGTGQLVRDLFHRGFEVHGIDMSRNAIELARQSTQYLGRGVSYEVRDVEYDGTGQTNIDIAFCRYVIAFISHKEAFVRSIARSLNYDGWFVLISPEPTMLPSDRQHIATDSKLVAAVCRQYFSEVEVKVEGTDQFFICRNPLKET